MRRDLHKFKIYYLFMINVSLVEENNYHNNLLSSDVNSTFISNSNFNSKIDDSSINFNLLNENINAPRNVIEKILHTTLNQKILYSNRLSYFILRKFFNTEILTIENKEEEEVEDYLEKKEQEKLNHNIHNLSNEKNLQILYLKK